VGASAWSGIITLMTDFGDKDGYVAQMKGVLLGIQPRATLVDISHRIAPQAILEGALVLRETVPHFPEGTIHLAVVDPGVGSSRRAVVARTRLGWLVGPDNGLLWPAAQEAARGVAAAAGAAAAAAAPVQATTGGAAAMAAPAQTAGGAAGGALGQWFQLADPRYQQPLVSPTFHGRDVFAPAAAHLSTGVAAEEMGPAVLDPVPFEIPEATPRAGGEAVDGEVLRVDRFGNLVTNVAGAHVLRLGLGQVIVEVAGEALRGVADSYASAPAGGMVCVVGSAGYLEVAESGGSAASRLGAGPGTRVTVRRA
jgi:hypothetical protein